MCYHHRYDVLWKGIFLPVNAPPDFHDSQILCNQIEAAERRYDARTAREFIGSLPNELPLGELIQIVNSFVSRNFVDQGLGVIVAIHEGKNLEEPSKNNPHVHILVTTRTIGPEGFNPKKDREHNRRQYIDLWREQWAVEQNLAYERCGLDIRVSHESLEVQGVVDREPTIHLSCKDWKKEQSGERTIAGDRKRAIQKRNRQRAIEQTLEHELEIDF